MSGGRKDEKERRGAGAPLPFGGGVDGLLRWLLTAPEAWLARVGAAAALSLNLAWLAAAVAMPPPSKSASLPGFGATRPSLDLSDTLFSPRSMITGFKAILAPDFAASESAPVPGLTGDASAESPLPNLGANLPRGGPAGSDAEKNGEKGKEKRDPASEAEAAAAAASGGLGGGGGPSGAVAGGLAVLRSAAAGTATSTSASMPAGGDVAGGALSRDRRAMIPGRKTIARAPARGKGALGQLRFAKNLSNAGRTAHSAERSYEASASAFGGQTAAPGGLPAAGGAGASAAPPISHPTGEGGPRMVSMQPNCPSGYVYDGANCQPLKTKEVTPYKGLVELARKFLIGAAILAALGLFLLMKGGPSGQLLGGLLLGAAIALALAAMAIGNTIKQGYGQTPQKEAIDARAKESLGR